MDNVKGFVTPLNHVNFYAKRIFGGQGKVTDCSVAYLDKDGGGPIERHSHAHNHLFFVVKGEAKVVFDDGEVVIRENDSYLVEGSRRHSVWNNLNTQTVMIGLTVMPQEKEKK